MLLCSINMFPQQICDQSAQFRWIQRLMQDGQAAGLSVAQPVGRRVASHQQRWDIDVELAAEHFDHFDAVLPAPEPLIRNDEVRQTLHTHQLLQHLLA
jgi:hypothetical protein